MTNQTTFTTVADGDQLSQGYFNGSYHSSTYRPSCTDMMLDNTYIRFKTTDLYLLPNSILASTTNMTSGVVSASGTYSGQTYAAGLGSTTNTGFVRFDFSIFKKFSEAGASVSRTSAGDGTGTTATNISNNLASEGYACFKYYLNTNTDSGSAARVSLYDGTNSVDLIAANGGGSGTNLYGFAEIYLDWVNDSVVLNNYLYKQSTSTDIPPIRTLTTTRLSTSSLGASVVLRAAATVDATSGSATSEITKVRGRKSSYSSTATCSVSSNGGTNFYSITGDRGLVTFTNAGPNIAFKLDGNCDDTEVIEWTGIYFKPLS